MSKTEAAGALSDGKGMGKLTYTAADWYEQRNAWIGQGKFQERQRIINLLEQFMLEPSDDLTYRVNRSDVLCASIELIKGEQK